MFLHFLRSMVFCPCESHEQESFWENEILYTELWITRCGQGLAIQTLSLDDSHTAEA